FLIGYMGAGKTTVGKDLAQRTGLSFIDLDCYIEGRYHKTVRQLFEEKGEEGFRDIERAMLREVATFENVLVSTGGGAPCFYDNLEFMNSVGTSIYLKVSVEELAARLELCKHTRPVLQGRSGEELKNFIRESLKKREPYYTKASIIFEAEEILTETDVENIPKALQKLL
ncbi:MAG: shikimate kinase, partial [Tannerellaceae bacterium]|nr:shikimate kinase [Tannerellaceae bacterium]